MTRLCLNNHKNGVRRENVPGGLLSKGKMHCGSEITRNYPFDPEEKT